MNILGQMREHMSTTRIKKLWWIGTRDMLADGLNKGAVSRKALLLALTKGTSYCQHGIQEPLLFRQHRRYSWNRDWLANYLFFPRTNTATCFICVTPLLLLFLLSLSLSLSLSLYNLLFMIAWQQVFAPPLTIISRPVSRGARSMAMTAPAMPTAASASQPQTLEEAAEALHAEYGRIRETISRNRALTTRRMGPYFRAEVLHEPLIPRFFPSHSREH